MWIQRDFVINQRSLGRLPIGILVGPRQVGKTRIVEHELGAKARILYLDDLAIRTRLQEDPASVLGASLDRPLFIDEAQYAPEIFSELKLRVDRARREGQSLPPIWLTGSNQTFLSAHVRESLAGRASYHSLHPLSVHELGERFDLGKVLIRGGWPELWVHEDLSSVHYLNDHIKNFVERDIMLSSGISKISDFQRMLLLLAGRTAQILNASEIGGHCGVKGNTIENWISLLEQNAVVVRIPPYFSNRNKRLVKSPKIFFLDVGLASRLQGWTVADPLLASPAVGSLFETLVLSELIKTRDHLGVGLKISFYRTQSGEEVDFLLELETPRGLLGVAIEVKLGHAAAKWPVKLSEDFPILREKWLVTPRSGISGTVGVGELAERIVELVGGD